MMALSFKPTMNAVPLTSPTKYISESNFRLNIKITYHNDNNIKTIPKTSEVVQSMNVNF